MKKLVLALLLMSVALPLFGGEVHLFYANIPGYQTTLVGVNPTAAPLEIQLFPGPVGSRPDVVAPHSVLREPAWAPVGGGVASLSAPDGLSLYTEVVDPVGVRVRIPDVGEARSEARYYDLLVGDGYVSYVFIYSPAGGEVHVTQRVYDDAATVMILNFLPGETKIVAASVPNLTITADTRWSRYVGEGKFQTVALMSRQPRGELLVGLPY